MSLLYSGIPLNATIRAYDFDRMGGLLHKECLTSARVETFVQGRIIADIVTANGANCYEILCDYDSAGRRTGETIYVPHETSMDRMPENHADWPRVTKMEHTA